MKRLVLVALVACMPTIATADWTDSQRHTQAAYTVLHVIDWLQTRDIASRDEFREVNPILGPDPTRREVDVYFAATLVGHYLVTDWLHPRYREVFQGVTLGMQATVTAHNFQAGVELRW